MSSSLEGNKIAGAILLAGVIASTCGLAAHILYGSEEMTEHAYVINVPEASASGEADTAASEVSLASLLADGDMAAGQKEAKKCASCHTFEDGAADKVGPNLWNVLDQGIANNAGFGYSDAMASHQGDNWTYDSLFAFLESPKAFVPGTKMSFAGISNPQKRANLIAYLRSLSDSPVPLPEVEIQEEAAVVTEEDLAADGNMAADGEAAASGDSAAAGGASLGAAIAAGDPAKGEKVAKKCKACHTLTEGGANKVGPHLWGVVGRTIASVEDFSYSSALGDLSGETWDFANLDGFLTSPKGWAKGTKMSFAGISKEGQRADLLAYLRTLSSNPVPLPE